MDQSFPGPSEELGKRLRHMARYASGRRPPPGGLVIRAAEAMVDSAKPAQRAGKVRSRMTSPSRWFEMRSACWPEKTAIQSQARGAVCLPSRAAGYQAALQRAAGAKLASLDTMQGSADDRPRCKANAIDRLLFGLGRIIARTRQPFHSSGARRARSHC